VRVNESHSVAVIGAGPAGMFAARELARAGAQVFVFNRDIKPGGLAEYGIYPDKHAMKQGLRNQFQQVLDTPGLTYYGNISLGKSADLTLDDLRECGFQAILVTVGAQGTKWLGLPGEALQGVYHAKDLVYHYNQLPPFSQKKFHFGKRVVIVGAGNVMLDIARFLMQKIKVDEVIAVVRRGPAEVKFDKKEMEYVAGHLSLRALDDELARVSAVMTAIGQEPAAARANILEALPKAQPALSAARLLFSFLASPAAILGNAENFVTGLEVEETTLTLKDGEVKARATGQKRIIPADSIVFAIGDRVDENFGLPTQGAEFAKNPTPRFPVDEISYEAFDPQTGQVLPDTFVAGWSRQASTGLVGYARKDGTNGAKAVLQYLATLPVERLNSKNLSTLLKASGKYIVSRAVVRNLAELETEEAQKRGLESFKFSTNEQMLEKITTLG